MISCGKTTPILLLTMEICIWKKDFLLQYFPVCYNDSTWDYSNSLSIYCQDLELLIWWLNFVCEVDFVSSLFVSRSSISSESVKKLPKIFVWTYIGSFAKLLIILTSAVGEWTFSPKSIESKIPMPVPITHWYFDQLLRFGWGYNWKVQILEIFIRVGNIFIKFYKQFQRRCDKKFFN